MEVGLCTVVVYCGGVLWWCTVVVYCGGVLWWCTVVVYCGGVLWWCTVVVYCGGVLWWCTVVVYCGSVLWWCTVVVYRVVSTVVMYRSMHGSWNWTLHRTSNYILSLSNSVCPIVAFDAFVNSCVTYFQKRECVVCMSLWSIPSINSHQFTHHRQQELNSEFFHQPFKHFVCIFVCVGVCVCFCVSVCVCLGRVCCDCNSLPS